jgi:hypothetical protein
MNKHLPPAWREAIIFGVIWGAMEVSLGSFLHALRIPFTGVILSSFGAALLVCGRQIFPRLGFCLRAGVICAGLKTLSPAGLIWGPFIAILVESVLIELAMLLPSQRIGGFLAGGLVVLWSLLQGLLTQVLFFGQDLLAVYEKLFLKICGQLGVSSSQGVSFFLIVVACMALPGMLLGAYSSVLGQRVSQRYWLEAQ